MRRKRGDAIVNKEDLISLLFAGAVLFFVTAVVFGKPPIVRFFKELQDDVHSQEKSSEGGGIMR